MIGNAAAATGRIRCTRPAAWIIQEYSPGYRRHARRVCEGHFRGYRLRHPTDMGWRQLFGDYRCQARRRV